LETYKAKDMPAGAGVLGYGKCLNFKVFTVWLVKKKDGEKKLPGKFFI
jgi:hypothetical protein